MKTKMEEERKTWVDIRYIDIGADLTKVPGLNVFLGMHADLCGRQVVDTFELSDNRPFLDDEQEKAVKSILGDNLREIFCYKELNHKYYNNE